jgi:hypothetical protein
LTRALSPVTKPLAHGDKFHGHSTKWMTFRTRRYHTGYAAAGMRIGYGHNTKLHSRKQCRARDWKTLRAGPKLALVSLHPRRRLKETREISIYGSWCWSCLAELAAFAEASKLLYSDVGGSRTVNKSGLILSSLDTHGVQNLRLCFVFWRSFLADTCPVSAERRSMAM